MRVRCDRCKKFISAKDMEDLSLRLEHVQSDKGGDMDVWVCRVCINIEKAFDMDPFGELTKAEEMGLIPALSVRENWDGHEWLIMADSLEEHGLAVAAQYFRYCGTYAIGRRKNKKGGPVKKSSDLRLL